MTSLYNFYIDDELKAEVAKQLELHCGKQEKGQMAALIRVLLKQFVGTAKPDPLLIAAIEAEYVYSTKKNKRSKL